MKNLTYTTLSHTIDCTQSIRDIELENINSSWSQDTKDLLRSVYRSLPAGTEYVNFITTIVGVNTVQRAIYNGDTCVHQSTVMCDLTDSDMLNTQLLLLMQSVLPGVTWE